LDEQESRCMKYLLGVEARLTDGKVPIRAEYTLGNPAQCILDRAQELGECLIVMNSHGREGLSRLWLGSVAEKVSRHATCPLFLVRHPPT
jgi:nucleotide-binding universal stress UspA family protein